MRGPVGGMVLVLAAVTVAGCGPAASGDVAPAPGTPVAPSWTSCAAEAPERLEPGAEPSGPPLPRLNDDFAPTAAVVCAEQPRGRADGGEELVAVESRADDVDALVAALRLPDEPRTDGACTMDLPVIPWIAILDAQDRWLRPRVPLDRCGKIRIEVREAVDGLTLTPVASRVVAELQSAEAAAAGCSQGWADMVAVATTAAPSGDGAPPAAGPIVAPWRAAKQVRICAYTVPPAERGSGKPAGTFAYGRLLTPAVRAAVEKALRTAGPVRTCHKPATQFAMLRAADGTGGEVYVELDGCQRVLSTPTSGRSVLRQGGPALTAPLTL